MRVDGLDCSLPQCIYSQSCDVVKSHEWFTLPNYSDIAVNRLPIHVRNGSRLGRKRQSFKLAGIEPNQYRFPNQTLHNLQCALVTRVYGVKHEGRFVKCPLPEPGIFDRLGQFRSKVITGMSTVPPISMEKFIASYQGRRKVIYENARASLVLRPLTRRDACVKAFVKAERMLPGKDPRIIQPREPRYNIVVGQWLKPMEKKLFKSVDRVWGHPTIMKGYNAHDCAQLLREKYLRVASNGGVVMIGLDASRFDQHVSLEALEYEHGYYLGCARWGHTKLRELLSWQLWNRGVGRTRDGKLKYLTRGCRMSGDMNTSLGNCLLMCALVHQYFEDHGIVGELANNGDDCVLFVQPRYVEVIRATLDAWFLRFGFEMTMEKPVTRFEEMEFCQTHCVFDGTRWVCVRNFPTFIAKDVSTVLPLSHGQCMEGYAGAISDCGLALAGGVPVADAFYRSMHTISKGVRLRIEQGTGWERGFVFLARGMSRSGVAISDQARASFYFAFGVLPDRQKILESQINRWGIEFKRDAECVPFWL